MIVDLAHDLIGYPALSIGDVVDLRGVAYPTAKRAVLKLEQMGVLREISGRNYRRVYFCQKVFTIMQSG